MRFFSMPSKMLRRGLALISSMFSLPDVSSYILPMAPTRGRETFTTTFADAVLFTFDATSPSVVPLRTTSSVDHLGSRIHQPHPQDYIEAYWSAQSVS